MMAPTPTSSVADRWTSYQKGVVALAALAIVFDGFDNQVLGFATPALIREWGITKGDMAPVAAIGLIGMTVGTMIAGVLGDRFGRRTMLIASVLLFGAVTCLIGLTGDLWQLGALRFVSGLGLGGAMPNATAIAAEYTPPKRRALAVTLTIVCVPLGGLVAGLFARTILPDMGWRALFYVAGALPLLVGLVLIVALPESPSFQANAPARQKARLADLFGPGIIRDTLSLWTAFFACLLAVYSVFSWAPTMLTEAGFPPTTASDGLSAFNFGGIGGALLAAGAIMAIGSRRSLMTLSAIAIAVAASSAIWVVGSNDATRVVLAFGVLGFAINGVQTTLFAVASHAYPDAIRATGLGAALGIGRIGAVLSTFLGAAALSSGGGSGYFALIATAMTVTLVALAILSRHIPRSAEL
jgi:AAHS family 4-hydroxybenzoate transporter-like MFS transporter